MRRVIAERMTRSFRDVPQFSVSRDVDMTAAGAARTAAGVSYADVLIWAVARTLVDHPRLTMRYDPEGLIAGDGIHLGIAVALDDGLLVPVLRDADTKELAAISRERSALQEGARAGKLAADALAGAVIDDLEPRRARASTGSPRSSTRPRPRSSPSGASATRWSPRAGRWWSPRSCRSPCRSITGSRTAPRPRRSSPISPAGSKVACRERIRVEGVHPWPLNR